MTFYNSFEEFEKAAEALYLQSPDKVRYSVKYTHSKNSVVMKITDNVIVRINFPLINVFYLKTSVFLFSAVSLKQK